MNRSFVRLAFILVFSLVILSACGTANPSAAIPNTDGTQKATATPTGGPAGNISQVGTGSQGGSGNSGLPGIPPGGSAPGTNPNQVANPNQGGAGRTGQGQGTRVARSTATPTPTVVKASATPTAAPASPTPIVFPTMTVSAAGQMTLPSQATQINFQPSSTSFTVTTSLDTHVVKAYQFQAKTGQILYVAVNGRTNLQLFSPSKQPLSSIMVMPGIFSVTLQENGAYTIGLDGLGKIVMAIYLPVANANLASAAPLPDKLAPFQLPPMPLTVSVDARLDANSPTGWTFKGQAGQTLSLTLYQGDIVPIILAPEGNTLIPNVDMFTGLWNYALPEDGNYSLLLYGTSYSVATLKTTALPTGAAPAAPAAGGTRIAIPSGGTTLSFSTYFDPQKPQTYVLNVTNGLLVSIDISGNAQVSQISGVDKTNLVVNHSQYSTVWSAVIPKSGDYTLQFSGSGVVRLTITIP